MKLKYINFLRIRNLPLMQDTEKEERFESTHKHVLSFEQLRLCPSCRKHLSAQNIHDVLKAPIFSIHVCIHTQSLYGLHIIQVQYTFDVWMCMCNRLFHLASRLRAKRPLDIETEIATSIRPLARLSYTFIRLCILCSIG